MNAKLRPYRIFWFLGVAVLLASAIGAGVALNPSQPSEAAPSVTDDDSFPIICIGYADVEPKVLWLYPTRPGRVVVLHARENQKYRAGELLLRVDPRQAADTLQAALAEQAVAEEQLAQAEKLPRQDRDDKVKQQRRMVKIAELQLAAAEKELEHKRELLKKKLLNKKLLDAATKQVGVLQQKVQLETSVLDQLNTLDVDAKARLARKVLEAKKFQVKLARLGVEECDLKAPVDGLVLRVLAGLGEVLGSQPRQAAIEFCPTAKPPIIRAEVQQEFAGQVVVGKPALIEDDTRAGPRWKGKVVRISEWYAKARSIIQEPLHYNDIRTLECIVEVDPGQAKLRIGQRVRVTIGGKP